MPRKIRQLKGDLARAGFMVDKSQGKGSHVKWRHPLVPDPVVLSGHDGDDAQSYQEKIVRKAVRRVQEAEEEAES